MRIPASRTTPFWVMAVFSYGACDRCHSLRGVDRGSSEDIASVDASADGAVRGAVDAARVTVRAGSDSLAPPPGCEEVAGRFVNALPEVKRAISDAQKGVDESDGRANLGGVGPIEDESGFTAGLGVDTAERFEARVWYSVDWAGHLTVTVDGDDLNVPGETVRAVERACKRR